MARKVETITIDTKGRDKGKVFVLTELSPVAAEKWATKALFAMLNAGVDIPDNIAAAGLAGIAAMGIGALTKMPFESAEPLLDDMMQCIQIRPSPTITRNLIDDDIEEVSTLLTLRKEIFNLHMSFFTDGAESTSGQV